MEVYDELDEAAKRSPKKVRGSKDTRSYQDGRSQAGMMVSGDSQVSGAGYMRRGGGILQLKQILMSVNRSKVECRSNTHTRDEMEYRKAAG
jgi:lipoate-protein ligase A